ncbi:MAG: TonB-dependent receptor plug domain-containing protein [Prevotella sp.]|nr:TonB-dependent receptor plug domain-containing protein [Prevotella sp.]
MRRLIILVSFLVVTATSCSVTVRSTAGLGSGVDSVKSIESSEEERSGYTDIYDYLRGKVPGLQIKGTDITIRGISSINAQGAPLILVDGVEIPDISSVNPQEIVRVDVLKDSATSIYGFKGSFGVIKITTKAGKGTEDKSL